MKDLLNLALQAALKAGSEICEVYRHETIQWEFKEDQTPLTRADQRAHRAIVRVLEPSGLPVLSEEGKNIPYAERKNWDTFWLVDPLDGTKEFIKRNGEFTVNIALIDRQQPVLGIIYVPVLETCYAGIVGQGAWIIKNIKQMPRSGDALKHAQSLPLPIQKPAFLRIVGSRSHMSGETLQFVENLKAEHPDIEMVSMGSSLKFCLVAEGSADIYPRFGPTMEWDTAAGHAIALAAGKKVTLTDQTTPLSYNKENLLNPWFIVQ